MQISQRNRGKANFGNSISVTIVQKRNTRRALYDFAINRTILSFSIMGQVLVIHSFFSNFACYEKTINN